MKLDEINIRDPFILAEDGKYYMYGTRGSSCWTKCLGIDVYVSDDLATWSEPIEVFTEKDNDKWTAHMWAPEVHKYNGAYYMFVTFNDPTNATYILRSSSPEGPFVRHSDGPVTPDGMVCLDGTFYVENGRPYMIFCHEWVQIRDGKILGIELTQDLRQSVGEPFFILAASTHPKVKAFGENAYVTDGPFLYNASNGRLIMIWSSFAEKGYLEAVSYSENGVRGPWLHSDHLLFEEDGGHGMIFRALDGKLKYICHQPNKTPLERPVIVDIEEKNGELFCI